MNPHDDSGLFTDADAATLRNHPAFTVPITESADLAVIAVHFNPCGYRRPRANLLRFLDELEIQRVPVFMLELTWDGQTPVLPEDNPRVLQIRSSSTAAVMWQKESLLNVLAHGLPDQFRKVAWVDADVLFMDADWLPRTSALLDKHPIIQLFETAVLTGPDGVPERMKPSVGWAAQNAHPTRADWSRFHPGFAWAARRALWTECGGLWGWSITGSGDSVLALAAMGKLRHDHPQVEGFSSRLFASAAEWGQRITAWTGGSLAALPGRVLHMWHGTRARRQYREKTHWVAELDPANDLARDPETGVLTWTAAAQEGKADMVRTVANYFSTRREDSPV